MMSMMIQFQDIVLLYDSARNLYTSKVEESVETDGFTTPAPLSLGNIQLSISMSIPFLMETSILKTLLVILNRNYFTHYHHEELVLDKLFCPKAVQ